MKAKIIQWQEWPKLTHEERTRTRRVSCGPDCEYCGEPNKGISIVTSLDTFGDIYPEATTVLLFNDEWIVYELDPTEPANQIETARYPRDKVVAIRNLPSETRLYGHTVLDEVTA